MACVDIDTVVNCRYGRVMLAAEVCAEILFGLVGYAYHMSVSIIHPAVYRPPQFIVSTAVRRVVLGSYGRNFAREHTRYGRKKLRRGVVRMHDVVITHNFPQVEYVSGVINRSADGKQIDSAPGSFQLSHERRLHPVKNNHVDHVPIFPEPFCYVDDESLCSAGH